MVRQTLSTTRRAMLACASVGFFALAAAGHPGAALAADQGEVAALFTGAVTQGNWDPPGYAAFQKMVAKYGYKPSYIEHASYEKAPALLRQLASRGVKMIVCHSSGYAAAIQEEIGRAHV